MPPPPQLSWQIIVEEALTQRITPLLHRWLDQPIRRHLISPKLMNHVKMQVVQHGAWNLLLSTELRTILAACERHGVACIPIRGPVLAEQLYGDGSVRQMDDLDLLVHHKDLSAIKSIFDQLGYLHHEHRPGFLETFSYSLEFVHPTHGFIVEPHWNLAYPPHLDIGPMQRIWRRSMRQRWMGIDALSLSPEDLLIHLCLHTHHKGHQAPLLWFYELDALIRQHGVPLDWNVFTEQTQLMEQSVAVADVLTALVKTFHSSIPDSVIRRLTERRRNTSASSSFVTRMQIVAQSSLSGREEFETLTSLQGLQHKLRYALTLLFPSLQYMTRRYGTSSPTRLVAFYLIRCFRIGAEGFRFAVTWITTALATRHS